jgi:hypothetical protein
MIIAKYHIKIRFPLWQYLKQLLVDKSKVINPFKFWHNYRVQMLENCWKIDSISLLEKCFKCELQH